MYWSHRRTDDLEGGPEGRSEHVAFQRMAHFAGLAYLDEVGCSARPPPCVMLSARAPCRQRR